MTSTGSGQKEVSGMCKLQKIELSILSSWLELFRCRAPKHQSYKKVLTSVSLRVEPLSTLYFPPRIKSHNSFGNFKPSIRPISIVSAIADQYHLPFQNEPRPFLISSPGYSFFTVTFSTKFINISTRGVSDLICQPKNV